MMKKKTIITITGGYRFHYFQWFILGFYELQKKGEVKLKIKLPFFQKMAFSKICSSNKYISGLARRIGRKYYPDDYNLRGMMLFPSGEKKFFCIDSADAPYLFYRKDLEKSDCYFKMQCPKVFKSEGFRLTDGIVIPWVDHDHVESDKKLTERCERKVIENFKQYVPKIKPLMIGTRMLAKNHDYWSLKKGYENYLSSQTTKKNGKLMCYFGNALGPKPEANVTKPDFDWEGDLMSYYKNDLSHPNEKRAIVADLISDCKTYKTDARVINYSYADMGNSKNEGLEIPIEEFCAHVAKFQYNFNVSGYRMSIPNRFIESFMVGTAIVTDKLALKWYLPFEASELKETVEMGYLSNDAVNWEQFKEDLQLLEDHKAEQTIACYEKKWVPEVVSRYIIDTVYDS